MLIETVNSNEMHSKQKSMLTAIPYLFLKSKWTSVLSSKWKLWRRLSDRLICQQITDSKPKPLRLDLDYYYIRCVYHMRWVCVCVCARRDHTTKCFINELIDAFRILFGIKPLTSLKLTRIRYVCGKKSRKKSKKIMPLIQAQFDNTTPNSLQSYTWKSLCHTYTYRCCISLY